MALARLLREVGHFKRVDEFGNSRSTVIDYLILSYLLTQENKEKNAHEEVDFQNQMFLHALANQNTKLYFKLYPVEEDSFQDQPTADMWEVPRSPEELSKMLAEFNVGRIS